MLRHLATLTFLAVLCHSQTLHAGVFCDDGGCKPSGCGCEVKWICCPKWEKEKIEKSCYDIECEHICVPKVKLPWQDCCTPRCARVICVHRLKKHTYECGEKCVLTFEAKAVCTRCCKPGYSRCPTMNCGPGPCGAPSEYHVPANPGLQPVPMGELLAPAAE
ncbi:MAG: hypothetical protein KDA75_03395 [Planctomycetaceae bacterium]|nr:hypothetical protein [Planctomycetaceae bacterium]